jgi:hypothetical protein
LFVFAHGLDLILDFLCTTGVKGFAKGHDLVESRGICLALLTAVFRKTAFFQKRKPAKQQQKEGPAKNRKKDRMHRIVLGLSLDERCSPERKAF